MAPESIQPTSVAIAATQKVESKPKEETRQQAEPDQGSSEVRESARQQEGVSTLAEA